MQIQLKKPDLFEFMMLVILIIAMIAGSGCKSKKSLAEKCAELYPVKDSLVIKDRIVNDTVLIPDSWVEYVDTTICPPGADTTLVLKPVIKKIPGKTVIVERRIYDTIYIRKSTAELAVLNNRINSLEKKNATLDKSLSKSKGKSSTWFWAFMILLAVSMGGAFLGLKKRFKMFS